MKRPSPAPRSCSPDSRYIENEETRLIRKLEELKGRECSQEYDKYSLLDERDKLLCQLRETNSSIVNQIERCEEMCTEKERYMRIVQKRASPFECDERTGEVSYDIMVKEYARSAADQERPLPHELRSEKLMNYTMSYLLHNVLDKYPENVDQRGMWYNFLWSRTRAVRKEVTQLSLSDESALNLVERCTRLHILFGYILCTLEVDHFDQKMNNENLGKCLQTLRHLYEDFERRGILCENEAEFRSYDVMLHMSDSNVLSQVLSYHNQVRQSKHVCLALQLVSSFQNKNYCKFFRLLKTDATFLQCCVSHQWFNQMRSNALSVMTRSYGTYDGYPVYKLQNLLAYDSTDDVKNALSCYGLRLDGDQVVLNRENLQFSEPPLMSTYRWIDEKKIGKFSQVVYGPRPFQFFSSRCDVSNSFDYQNRYVNDKILNTVLSSTNLKPISSNFYANSFTQSTGSLTYQMTIYQKKKEEMERIKKIETKKKHELVEKLLNTVIDEVVESIADEAWRKEKMIRKQKRKFEEEVKKQVEAEIKKKEMEKEKTIIEIALTKKIAANMEKEISEKVVLQILEEEIKYERNRREKKIATNIMEKLLRKGGMKNIDEYVMNICVQMIEEKQSVKRGLTEFRKNVARRWIGQFWNRWREWAILKREKREKRHSMLQKCTPRWDDLDVANELVRKYAMTDSKTSNLRQPFVSTSADVVKLSLLEKKRKIRMSRKVLKQWRSFTKERKMTRIIAKTMKYKENQFFDRFKNGEDIHQQQRFSFNKPEDIFCKNRLKKSESFQMSPSDDNNSQINQLKLRRPLKESQSFILFSSLDTSFNNLDNSLCLAREQIEKGGWKGTPGMSTELKEKLKRRRASIEAEQKEHDMKRKKQEEIMTEKAKMQNTKMTTLTQEADCLLEETNKFKSEMQKMMDELKLRKVADL